jgi:hypothetical protein
MNKRIVLSKAHMKLIINTIMAIVTLFLTKHAVSGVIYEQNQWQSHSITFMQACDVVRLHWQNYHNIPDDDGLVVVRNGWHKSNAYPEEHITIDVYPIEIKGNYFYRYHYDGNGHPL